MHAQSPSCVRLFVMPWIVVQQASLSMNFPGKKSWSGLPFPIPGDPPNLGIEVAFLCSALAVWILYHYVIYEALSFID